MKEISIETSTGEIVKFPLNRYIGLEGSEDQPCTIWWEDETGLRHAATTKAATKEIQKIISAKDVR